MGAPSPPPPAWVAYDIKNPTVTAEVNSPPLIHLESGYFMTPNVAPMDQNGGAYFRVFYSKAFGIAPSLMLRQAKQGTPPTPPQYTAPVIPPSNLSPITIAPINLPPFSVTIPPINPPTKVTIPDFSIQTKTLDDMITQRSQAKYWYGANGTSDESSDGVWGINNQYYIDQWNNNVIDHFFSSIPILGSLVNRIRDYFANRYADSTTETEKKLWDNYVQPLLVGIDKGLHDINTFLSEAKVAIETDLFTVSNDIWLALWGKPGDKLSDGTVLKDGGVLYQLNQVTAGWNLSISSFTDGINKALNDFANVLNKLPGEIDADTQALLNNIYDSLNHAILYTYSVSGQVSGPSLTLTPVSESDPSYFIFYGIPNTTYYYTSTAMR